MRKTRVAKRLAANFCIFLVFIAVLGVAVLLLWNALVPELFDGPVLVYWQAVSLLLLSHIMLRETPYYGRRGRRNARRQRCVQKKMATISSEERAAINDELGFPRDGSAI
ncbi:MAG: hypothetical protein ACJ0SL_08190 [Candidatus Rariloculaceae bacterium]